MMASLSKGSTLIGLFLCLAVQQCLATTHKLLRVQMPDVRPEHDDFYLCTARRLNPDMNQYIVGFQPNASMKKVHHMIVFGCKLPGKMVRDTPRYAWNCGEMGGKDKEADSAYEHGSACGPGHSSIIFAWALDAPPIELPEGVGFQIGGDSNIDYLVLQVHYGHTHLFQQHPLIRDESGIDFEIVSGPDHGIKKRAGIHLMMSSGYVEPGLTTHHMQCTIKGDKVRHPFRFRTHTHKLGTFVAGYIESDRFPEKRKLIGSHDPQKPQMFYPVEDKTLTFEAGDTINAYCRFNNTQNKNVYIGATGNDEMCNYYIMYWTDGNSLPPQQDCVSYNPSRGLLNF